MSKRAVIVLIAFAALSSCLSSRAKADSRWDFDEFVCGMHVGGNWGTTEYAIANPPAEYFLFLESVNANWVGFNISMTVEHSMDSTIEECSGSEDIATFQERDFRNIVRELRERGFHVCVTLAFENMGDGPPGKQAKRWELGDPNAYLVNPNLDLEYWPWHPDHPQHESYVSGFFESYTEFAVHWAEICEEEGVELYSLGAETDRLFRTRTRGPEWPTEFRDELSEMVRRVREVYRGALSYEMLFFSLTEPFPEGLHSLWYDIGLDTIDLSAYFRLLSGCSSDGPPAEEDELVESWRDIFRKHLSPLAREHPDLPIIFTEFGYVDSVGSACDPAHMQFQRKVFVDANANGTDDGEEEQQAAYSAFFQVLQEFPGIVDGIFSWGEMIASEQQWDSGFGHLRGFGVRGKLVESTLREAFGLLSGEVSPNLHQAEPSGADACSWSVDDFEGGASLRDTGWVIDFDSAESHNTRTDPSSHCSIFFEEDPAGNTYLRADFGHSSWMKLRYWGPAVDITRFEGIQLELWANAPMNVTLEMASIDPLDGWKVGLSTIRIDSKPRVFHVPFSDLLSSDNVEGAFVHYLENLVAIGVFMPSTQGTLYVDDVCFYGHADATD